VQSVPSLKSMPTLSVPLAEPEEVNVPFTVADTVLSLNVVVAVPEKVPSGWMANGPFMTKPVSHDVPPFEHSPLKST